MLRCRLLFALLTIIIGPGFAFGAGFKAGEITPTFQSPEAVGFSMNYDYDGSYGSDARAIFAARSADGTTVSYFPVLGYILGKTQLVEGKNQRIELILWRPGAAVAQLTEKIYLGILTDRGLAYSILLPQSINWSVVTVDQPSYTEQRRQFLAAWQNDTNTCWLTYDFACIESAFEIWRDGKSENADGISKLATLAATLRVWMNNYEPEMSLVRLKQWKAKFPRSQAQALAEAIFWSNGAEDAIGCRDCPSSEPAAARLYVEDHKKAIKALQAVPVKERSPLWHALYLHSLGAIQGESNALVKAYKAAISAAPAYPSIYVAMADVRLYADKHAWTAVEALAQQAAASTSDAADSALLYSKVYVELARSRHAVVTERTAISWPQMKLGLNEAVRRHPRPRNENVAAVWACSARDADMYAEFRKRIADHVLSDLWPSNQSLDLCDHRLNYFTGAKP